MKKIGLVCIAALFTISCNKDDDNNNDNGGDVAIEGTWKITSVTTQTPIDLNEDGVSSTDYMAETGCLDNSTAVFNTNLTGVFNLQDIDIDEDGVYNCNPATPLPCTYTVSGNNVNIVAEGQLFFVGTKAGNRLTATFEEGLTVVFTKL